MRTKPSKKARYLPADRRDLTRNGTQSFYALPIDLLKLLRTPGMALNKIDPRLYELEIELASNAANHPGSVGTWNGHTVIYGLLARPQPMTSLKKTILENFRNQPDWQDIIANLDQNLAAADSRSERAHSTALGYCGWLMSNPQFIKEHDKFFVQWHDQVMIYGLPRREPQGTEKWLGGIKAADRTAVQYGEAYTQLLDRWELISLAGPYLPIPRGPQFPVLLPHQIDALVRGGGQILHLPSTVPVPSRETARDLIAGAKNALSPVHLSEWHGIISTDTAANRIQRFARLFHLQHYWMILHRRWGERLKGHKEKLMGIFAAWLMPDDIDSDQGFDSIRKDLRMIARKRGTDWCTRPNGLDQF